MFMKRRSVQIAPMVPHTPFSGTSVYTPVLKHLPLNRGVTSLVRSLKAWPVSDFCEEPCIPFLQIAEYSCSGHRTCCDVTVLSEGMGGMVEQAAPPEVLPGGTQRSEQGGGVDAI